MTFRNVGAAALLSLTLAACSQAPDTKSATTNTAETASTQPTSAANLPPLRKQFACLPESAALVAAHRGTSKKADLPENAAGSLKALIKAGIQVAEVDVAGLKDGTHILFHDGIWDDKSTGSGPVAASTWGEVQKFLLKTTEGKSSADRPVSLSDALDIAKDKLYLEVDFKSSAKYDHVVKMIRDKGMADQVLLIAYNEGQAKALAKRAPEMLMSVGVRNQDDFNTYKAAGVKPENMASWMGRGPYNASELAFLKSKNIPALTWPGSKYVKETAAPASLIVSDYALQLKPIEGMKASQRAAYDACLKE